MASLPWGAHNVTVSILRLAQLLAMGSICLYVASLYLRPDLLVARTSNRSTLRMCWKHCPSIEIPIGRINELSMRRPDAEE